MWSDKDGMADSETLIIAVCNKKTLFFDTNQSDNQSVSI